MSDGIYIQHWTGIRIRILPIGTMETDAPPPAPVGEYLTIEELQRTLKVGRSKAYEIGRLHGRRFGRMVRVPRSAIAALLDEAGR